MSALPQIEPARATGEAAALLAQMRKSSGPVPNMAKAMANSPALLKGSMDLSGALAGGALPAAVRERLALATAEYNRCTYSADLYCKLQKQTLNQRLRRRIVEGIPYGMALGGLTAADLAYQPKTWNAAVIRQASQEIKSQERFPLGSANRTRSRLGEFGITPMAVLTVWKRRVSSRLHTPT